MTALVLTKWHDRIHAAIDHGPAKRVSENLATEVARIPLTDAEAALSIDAVLTLYAAAKLGMADDEEGGVRITISRFTLAFTCVYAAIGAISVAADIPAPLDTWAAIKALCYLAMMIGFISVAIWQFGKWLIAVIEKVEA